MQKIVNNKIFLLILTFTLWSTTAFADDDPGGIGGDPGAPAAPIDNWIPLMILLAIAIVVYFISKRKLVTN